MLKKWSFWKAFFTTYLALVAGIWGFGEAYTYFEDDSLKQLLGSNWWMYYYVVPLFIAILFVVWLHSDEDRQAESLDQHNRRVMLNHVENFWVKGILEKSLHGVALLELGIKEDPSAVNYPWAIKRESTNETLPAGKSMLEVFEEIGAGRSLLILGAPGSGKTTMLLELARQLIEHARNDETEPVPVVFNLSSWTEKQTLAEWLAEQLNAIYSVPRKTAPKWVSENKMLLLLDGLDEVEQADRTKCVEAINQFRKEHGLTSLAVCSRIEEYQAISAKLALDGAITLQPLTPQQVDDYFDRFGNSLASVRQLLKNNKTLEELAETPLMLSIMTLAYKDRKPEELPASNSEDEQRKRLFNTYINRMFERPTRNTSTSFTKKQTLHYLRWLARKMIEQNLITYQIEAMQPSWLDDKKQQRKYKWIVGLIVGLIGGLIFGLIFGLSGGLICGLIGGLIGAVVDAVVDGLSGGLISGLIGGLIFGLSFGLMGGLIDRIQMVDKLSWSWQKFRRNLIVGLIFGLIFGLSVGLSVGLIGGLSVGLSVGLNFGLRGGLRNVPIEETYYPGQRIKQTLYNGILKGLIVGLSFGLIFGLSGGLSFGLIFVLIFGLSFGLSVGLSGGLDALIQHFVLRNMLIKNGFLPRQLILFLDYAVDLIFLRRVGGSYIFVHRLLMEHFAEMEVEKP